MSPPLPRASARSLTGLVTGIDSVDRPVLFGAMSSWGALAALSAGFTLLLSPSAFSQTANNPLVGYPSYQQAYNLPYAAGAGLTASNGPRINAVIAGSAIELPVDTGSRALYAAKTLLPGIPNPEGPAGYVYLNSSARIFRGTWSTQTITFPDATAIGNAPVPAQAVVPVLVVDMLACSTTPPPGSATASTTFRTIPESGTVVLTNGETAAFSNHTLTLAGGQSVSYDANPGILAPVVNFGVGFDRTGQGTSPNNNAFNQQYNAFFNLLPMRTNPPTMRAGYVLAQSGIQLGLTSSDSGYAYTNLLPTGLSQNPPSPPDWQAPMGNIVYQGTAYGTGQLVVDTGINFAILTLPGLTGATATPPLTVNLLNSDGAVSYTINTEPENTLNPTSIDIFPPLAGNFPENTGAFRDQFFNTGRNLLNAFDLLYDAVDGYVGLKKISTPDLHANIQFAPGFYPAPIPPDLETVTIPLAVFNVSQQGDASPTWKLGIYVGLGGGAPQLYEFDTGGTGFFAAQNNNPDGWWPASGYNVVNPGQTFTATYSSGIEYTAQLVTTDIAIYGNPSADPVAVVNANVGQIVDATGGSPGDTRMMNWTGYEENQETPPIWEHFYGDFGANLSPYAGSNFFINTILPQLPGNLSSGFIVSVGDYAAPNPTLQLGLTDADRASFPIQIPLLDADPSQPYPGSGYPSYGFFQTWGYFTLSLNGVTQTAPTEVILDTGAPSMTIRTGTSLVVDANFLNGKAIQVGTEFSLVSGPWTLGFTAGTDIGLNAIAAAPSVNPQNYNGYINTGLNAFFACDVMFDVERGMIGFRPSNIPPPPPIPEPPKVRISGPNTVRTSKNRIRIHGSVRSHAPLASVEFQRGKKNYQRCQGGGSSWSFVSNLKKGRTVFRVRGVTTSGITGKPAKVVVIRKS
jgi:hypothetical protein